MLWLQLERDLNVLFPAIQRLARQTSNQIEADICKTASSQIREGSQCISGVVRTTELCEFSIVKSLCAKTGAVNSQSPKLTEFFRVHAPRIYLERDLRRFIDREMFVERSENALEL